MAGGGAGDLVFICAFFGVVLLVVAPAIATVLILIRRRPDHPPSEQP